jgi:hypothetical protein
MNDHVEVNAMPLRNTESSGCGLRRYCDRCKKERHTVIVGGIEAGTGPGWDIRFCRPCLAVVLADARRLAGNGDHIPALPAYY